MPMQQFFSYIMARTSLVSIGQVVSEEKIFEKV
jgi:hypothetical protein